MSRRRDRANRSRQPTPSAYSADASAMRRRRNLALGVFVVLTVAAVLVGFVAVSPGATSPVATPVDQLAYEVDVSTAAALQDRGAFVLDVREPSEWAAGHLPGATLIPLGQLPSRLAEVPRDRDIVVVCRTGRRSAEGRDILLGAGFDRVTSMAGGINAWKASGRPVVTGA
jgi:rhodanese-related sulfurtransferase